MIKMYDTRFHYFLKSKNPMKKNSKKRQFNQKEPDLELTDILGS